MARNQTGSPATASDRLFYARFMDDWVVLAPSRWRLRRVVKQVNQILVDLKICPHPEKTFVGRTERGFDFLGYEFLPGVTERDSSQATATGFCVRVSRRAAARFVERFGRLYEQGADNHRLGQYVRRWMIWVKAGSDIESFGATTTYQNCDPLAPCLIPDALCVS